MTKNKTSEKGPLDTIEQAYVDIAKKMKDYDLYHMPRLLRTMFTLEEANIVRELPAPFADVAKKLNVSEEYVEKVCRKLVKEGKILQTEKGPRAFNYGAQFGDILLADPSHDAGRPPEFFEHSLGYFMTPEHVKNEVDFFRRMRVNGQPINRVVPRWKAIKDMPGVMPCEDIREILKAYADTLNTTRCVCRTGARGMSPVSPCNIKEGPGTLPVDGNCIHFGKMAEYFTEIMELTPYRSVEDIMKHIEKLDHVSIYHMAPNDRDVKWICNCCDCCCMVAMNYKKSADHTLGEMLSKSRFLALVEQSACTGCEECVKICPFHAISMKNGKAHIDAEECYGCGTCVINCAVEAMSMKIVRPAEHIPEGGAQLVDIEVLEVKEMPFRT